MVVFEEFLKEIELQLGGECEVGGWSVGCWICHCDCDDDGRRRGDGWECIYWSIDGHLAVWRVSSCGILSISVEKLKLLHFISNLNLFGRFTGWKAS